MAEGFAQTYAERRWFREVSTTRARLLGLSHRRALWLHMPRYRLLSREPHRSAILRQGIGHWDPVTDQHLIISGGVSVGSGHAC
ncbi:hypothetical protein DL89DRAFT_69435 [Linderina pennispora]|uniref:Uncharacterized protein n=1 Tax=Linderina pennispora TaxID=61395 RepID=A0A1Y1VYH5_9FUNG|nr:uncharacterized protein DL89DRAFT_69435 [Linderina pennispora]ORX66317.1 hypothetical protein DL89DRAFT_69435 [Linderina pennispora]